MLLETISHPEERQRIVVKKGNNIVIVPVHTVHYLEAFDDYVKVHTKEGFYLKKKTMAHFEKALDPQTICACASLLFAEPAGTHTH